MIGTTVAGRYHIEAQIGIGGMGVVYRARDERLRRDVALKVIAPHLMQQPAARARFLREAQALAGLTHPNIVTVHDLAEDADADLVLLIMELLTGQSLRQAMEDDTCPRSLECPPFSQVALPLCRALEAAHARGILHRDIKPENIFLCQDGTLKLMDFGLARLLGDVSKNHSSTVAGTLAYMAPEQLRGEPLDARADLYALGVVVYEFLAERLPFVADNPGAVLMKHLTETPPRLQSTRPELPDALDAWIARMLEKDPDARFASAHDARLALEQPCPPHGTLALAVDHIQSIQAHSVQAQTTQTQNIPATAAERIMPQTTAQTTAQGAAANLPDAFVRDMTAATASLPTVSDQAHSVAAALDTTQAQPTKEQSAAPTANAAAPARVRRRARNRTVPLAAGWGGAITVAALLVGRAWPHSPVRAVAPPARNAAQTAPGFTPATPAPTALDGTLSAARRSSDRVVSPSAAPRPTILPTPKGGTGAATGLSGGKAQGVSGTTDTKPDSVLLSTRADGANRSAGASAQPPLSNSERAELETLRREQQEELELLRSLKKQIGNGALSSARTPAVGAKSIAAVPIHSTAPRLPSASHATNAASAASPAVGSPPPQTDRAAQPHASLPTAQSPLASSSAITSGAAGPNAATPPQRTPAAGETSEFEEARPHTPLQLRVTRHAASGDSRAIHVNFRNSTDCYAYFYVVDMDKRRATRAYPGPERFLTPQTAAPQDIRLPLPADMDNNRKSVLILAAEQEITNLPPAFDLPPAPLNMPAPGAGLPQMRQAIHRYNDQIGMLLQQSRAQVNGKLLHPHDVLIRVTGLRPPASATR